MILRKIAALALTMPLFHLNVARADSACATHQHSETATHAEHVLATTVPDHSGHGASNVRGSIAQEDSCDTPTLPECCEALASCSLAFGGDVESAVGSHAPTHEVAIAALTDIPLSRIATPDPPPPRA